MTAPEPRVVLYSREGCHLCEAARALVEREAAAVGALWVEVDVATDPALEAEHGDLVPVVFVDGVRRGIFRIDETRLRRALAATPS
ncbi:MAG: glutaredoxin family protein [Actinomycetales bacterium]|nr:glutaredoxin family protein [Actinomycetales bacterium]